MRRLGIREIRDPHWPDDYGLYTDECHVSDYPEESRLLGPDGRPLKYAPRTPVGFDLRPRRADP